MTTPINANLCQCQCHKDGGATKHIMSCCYLCPVCGNGIALGPMAFNNHVNRCRQEHAMRLQAAFLSKK